MDKPSAEVCTPGVAPGRADLHMHTTASDGWPTPEELVEHAARRAKLDVIAVTDHDTIDGALRAREHASKRARFPVIVGGEGWTRDGPIVAPFPGPKVRPGRP